MEIACIYCGETFSVEDVAGHIAPRHLMKGTSIMPVEASRECPGSGKVARIHGSRPEHSTQVTPGSGCGQKYVDINNYC
jgi:hypothetical protein